MANDVKVRTSVEILHNGSFDPVLVKMLDDIQS